MSTDKEAKELEKYWRQSRKAIPVCAALLFAAAGILWLLTRFFPIPVWVPVLVLGLLASTLLADVINCF